MAVLRLLSTREVLQAATAVITSLIIPTAMMAAASVEEAAVLAVGVNQ
jgi:hypothetical protein